MSGRIFTHRVALTTRYRHGTSYARRILTRIASR
jgi:hypothetical protein